VGSLVKCGLPACERTVRAGALTQRGRRCALQPRRIVLIVIASGGLGLGGLGLLGGCGDESKTTGTQLQISPERKAEIEDMRSIMKQERTRGKQGRAAKTKKGE